MRGIRRELGALAAILAAVLTVGGCSPSGSGHDGIVQEATNEAQEYRMEGYRYLAETEGLSPAEVDQRECERAAMLSVGDGLLDVVYPGWSEDIGGRPYDAVREDFLDIGDTEAYAAAEVGYNLGAELALNTDLTAREQILKASSACPDRGFDGEPEFVTEVLEHIDFVTRMTASRYGGGSTWVLPDGTHSPVEDDPTHEGTIAPEPSQEPAEVSPLGCTELLADLLVAYAYGEIDQQEVLAHFQPPHHHNILDLLVFVDEEVGSGHVHPNDAATLLGNISWDGTCFGH